MKTAILSQKYRPAFAQTWQLDSAKPVLYVPVCLTVDVSLTPPCVGGLPFPASTLEEPFSSTREHHVASTEDDHIPTVGLLKCVCAHVHFNNKIYLPFSFPLPLTALHLATVFINRLWQFLAPYFFSTDWHPSCFKTSIKMVLYEFEIYVRVIHTEDPVYDHWLTCVDCWDFTLRLKLMEWNWWCV